MSHSSWSSSLRWSIGLLVSFVLILCVFYYSVLTGFVGLDVEELSLQAGEPVTGHFSYDLSTSALPLDSTVTLGINGYERTASLVELIDPSIAQRAHAVPFAPALIVVLDLYETGLLPPGYTSSDGPSPSQGGFGQGSQTGSGSRPGQGLAISSFEEVRTYTIRASDAPLQDIIPSRRSASLREVRLASTDTVVDSSLVRFHRDGRTISLTSNYWTTIDGFSDDEEMSPLSFPLEPFDFVVPLRATSASVSIRVSYGGDTLALYESTLPVLPPVDRSALAPPEAPPTEVAGPRDETCIAPLCSEYGECGMVSFADPSFGFSFVRTRQCMCQDGRLYTETESCSQAAGSASTVATGVQSAGTSVPLARTPPSTPSEPSRPSPSGSVSSRGWDRTYVIGDSTVAVSGGVSRLLQARERISLPIEDRSHFVGVVSLERGVQPRVLIEVASTPQQFYLGLSETRTVDVTDDGLADLSVSFIALSSRDQVLLRVEPLRAPFSSQLLQEGDQGATLLRLPDNLPIGYVILNDELPALRVFFVQSAASLPLSCFNSVQDNSENGIDCGGACKLCVEEREDYTIWIAWASVLFLFGILMIVSRR